MGILNATPDSFSDGALLNDDSSKNFKIDLDKALTRAEAMVKEGALFIDIGGESTRPGAAIVSLQEEIDRVIPIIEALHSRIDVCISVDTSKPEVMKQAIAAGARLINDVRALSLDGAMDVVKNSNAALCVMHMQGKPETMQSTISYDDVVDEVIAFLREKVSVCKENGISPSRLLIDPGFGFGKTVEHNYRLLAELSRFSELQTPLLVGVSRKSMIGAAIDRPVDQRLAGSIAATAHALAHGAKIMRSHDVAATMDAIRVNSAISSARKS
ncbi:MAG: dihydropteroate synthase [Gammaproteobacteria bacterium]|jgi:dihydropteroate synthase|nr:dihydropteroate synthase [Gammaproteobacteria bacterium]MBT3858270.1 dihydropteroate synthase [Gammaproteobacteria bacterium]MBT3988607.1 dihydropteroate synthase [Gammaproteobacteria bacterium]MBT4255576.1 dihydropteroate synthase [Gammaproteobacteria bacterium]MBT4580455.1 dihydropteroate synthase [Gammaproteobacteria bacterium]